MERLCLVTGATGYVGGRLVPRLLDAGWRVRVLARHPDGFAICPGPTTSRSCRATPGMRPP